MVLKTSRFSETVESIKSGYSVSFPFRLNEESNIELYFETPTEGIKKEKITLSSSAEIDLIDITIDSKYATQVFFSKNRGNYENLIKIIFSVFGIAIIIFLVFKLPNRKKLKEKKQKPTTLLCEGSGTNLKLHWIVAALLAISQLLVFLFLPSQIIYFPIVGLLLVVIGFFHAMRRIGFVSFLANWRWDNFDKVEAVCFIYGITIYISFFAIVVIKEIIKIIFQLSNFYTP